LVEFGHLYKLTRRNIDIRTVNKDTKFWWNLVIWGTFYGVAGRFSKRHKRCIRVEDNKSIKQIMDKLLIQMMSLLVLY
jgi:hypothetical protein